MGTKCLLLLCILFAGNLFSAEVPAFVNYVNDFANVLNEGEERALNERIKQIKDSSQTEIAVVTESSLNGLSEFDRSLDFARTYKVGAKGMNTGVLIYIAIAEHKIFIQTADKTQGELTDYIAAMIIDRSMKPEFRNENYYQGISNAVESINQVLKGEFKPGELRKRKKGTSVFFIFGVIMIVVYILSRFGGGRNGGFMRGGGYFLPGMLMGGGGRGWGGGGSSGGGGFGGFGGGGGFNGGGAGGSW